MHTPLICGLTLKYTVLRKKSPFSAKKSANGQWSEIEIIEWEKIDGILDQGRRKKEEGHQRICVLRGGAANIHGHQS
jgi:hypothetical protein